MGTLILLHIILEMKKRKMIRAKGRDVTLSASSERYVFSELRLIWVILASLSSEKYYSEFPIPTKCHCTCSRLEAAERRFRFIARHWLQTTLKTVSLLHVKGNNNKKALKIIEKKNKKKPSNWESTLHLSQSSNWDTHATQNISLLRAVQCNIMKRN